MPCLLLANSRNGRACRQPQRLKCLATRRVLAGLLCPQTCAAAGCLVLHAVFFLCWSHDLPADRHVCAASMLGAPSDAACTRTLPQAEEAWAAGAGGAPSVSGQAALHCTQCFLCAAAKVLCCSQRAAVSIHGSLQPPVCGRRTVRLLLAHPLLPLFCCRALWPFSAAHPNCHSYCAVRSAARLVRIQAAALLLPFCGPPLFCCTFTLCRSSATLLRSAGEFSEFEPFKAQQAGEVDLCITLGGAALLNCVQTDRGSKEPLVCGLLKLVDEFTASAGCVHLCITLGGAALLCRGYLSVD